MRESIPFQESPEQRITSASSIDELKSILYILKRVRGTQKIYTGEELVDIIDKVRSGNLDIEYLPRLYGLRDTVARLLATKNELDEIRQKSW